MQYGQSFFFIGVPMVLIVKQ